MSKIRELSQKRTKKMTMAIALVFVLSGCANTPKIVTPDTQTITKAMTIVPPRPAPPDPETATQRDVATYIVLLRGWGNAMALQLDAIRAQLK